MNALRHKIIGAVLGLVGVAFGIDMLTGGPGGKGPKTADGAPTGIALLQASGAQASRVPADLQSLIAAVQATNAPASRGAASDRDLFSPSGALAHILRPPPELLEETAGADPRLPVAEAEPVPPAELFAQRYRLTAVVTGPVTLALINGVLYPRDAVIEGFRIVTINAEGVRLSDGDTEVLLALQEARLNSAPR